MAQLGTCHVITIKSKDKITDVEYAAEIETLWLDYVLELASEARA